MTEKLILHAARVKAKHKLSFADAFVAATAEEYRATIVTADREFEGVFPNIMWL